MKNALALLAIILTAAAYAQKKVALQLTSPPQEITMLGEGLVSTYLNERDFAFSPDGKEFYYTVSTPRSSFQTIVFCRKTPDGNWSSPEIVPFAGQFSDLEPTFSPDGKFMYFASNRPLTGDKLKDFDIWRVPRNGDAWGTPENLGKIINTETDEFYPSLTRSGNLYFTASYNGGVGKEDIYIARHSEKGFQKPVALDSAINSPMYEFNAFISPNEDYILFTSFGRSDDAGRGDLYISIKDPEGKWKKAVNLKQVNSPFLDYCPYVTPDGRSLILTSERHQLPTSFNSKVTYKRIADIAMNPLNGTGNIYWVDFQKLLAELNSAH